MELKADLLLADDRKARRAARERGLVITGALGVLEPGSAKGLIRLKDAVERLRATDFFIAETIIEDSLRRDRERRGDA
ncbi:MAG: hypothetical protein FLDDKLPJ_00925 [Phycisphaerae bacterium]|nr:hypothetical protein [Phycisphaerae bacterium]